MTNTKAGTTNRRGTPIVDGRQLIRDAKRTSKRSTDTYDRRDMRNMCLVTGLSIALMYTSLWLIAVLQG